MRGARESAEALKYLGGVFSLVEVNGEEHIVIWQIQGRRLAGAEEVGDILHLDKGHSGFLELDARRTNGKIDESVILR